jgi:predicted dinucleotide-binding enzyme
MKKQHVGLIGAGNVGSALAKRLVELGYWVKVANSKGPQSLQEFAQRTGARAVKIQDVATDVDVLILAVPLGNVGAVRQSLGQLPLGLNVVDTGNYVPQRDGAIAEIEQGLPESTWVSQQLGVPVVKAFNNIIALGLVTNGLPKGAQGRIALPVAGDVPTARAAIMGLVEELGFGAFDAGSLADSWRQQPGQPAYCTDPTVQELPLLLARADRQKAGPNRDHAMKIMAKLPPSFSAQDLVRISRLSIGLDIWRASNWFAMLRLGVALLRA